MNKKYYWLKLNSNFFYQSEIKKLRSLENGDLYTLIYLKLQLLSITTEGKLFYKGLEDNFAQDLAWEIDERAEDIQTVLLLLEKYHLLEMVDEECLLLTKVAGVIGKEGESTARGRSIRSNDFKYALQCNTNVTKCNTEIELELKRESEIEIELELDPEKELKKENDEVVTRISTPAYNEDKNSVNGAKACVDDTSAALRASNLSKKEIGRQQENLQEEQRTNKELQIITERILSRINIKEINHQASIVLPPPIIILEDSFDDFWLYYPKAYDRARTFQLWQQTIARGIAPADLVCAAKKYAEYVKKKQTLLCYVGSARNFLLNNKFWDFLPTYLLTCSDCHGKGIFSKANLAGEQEYYRCNCNQRYNKLSRAR